MQRTRAARSHARLRNSLVAVLIGAAACQSSDVTSPSDQGTVVQTGTPVPTSSANPLSSFTFYIDQASNARKTADAWRSTRPADATEMDKLASQPVARWLGDWNTNIQSDVASAVATIGAAASVPVFVAYDIPQRDCGSYSAGGAASPSAYRSWISGFAAGLGTSRAVIVLEPDALAGMDCLSAADQATRIDLLHYAVATLTADPNARVYLDAGNPTWKSAATMADRLARAGIDMAAGFSLNVSNFFFDADNVEYGTSISGLVGGKHFIIDSGRNGLGPTADMQWCNPDGRAIGRRPTTNTGNALVDAFLWIKTPGESDGSCNGAPASGVWMPEYALGLAQRG